jgi:hypothetical protein
VIYSVSTKEKFDARRVVGIDTGGDLCCRSTGRCSRKPAVHPEGHRSVSASHRAFGQTNSNPSRFGRGPSTWQGRSRPIIVDIDFVADGVSETYSFMCVLAQGAAFVQRTMN